MESVLDFVAGFFSCGFKLFVYLLTVALVGWVLGLIIPLFYFIPTAIAYFFLSFLLLIFSVPLYGCFLRNKAKIKDAPLELTEDDMPVLRPIPTATVHQDGWFNKLLAYMFVPRTWRLMQNWHWTSESLDGTEIELVVPKGFECDAASIPRPFRALFNPTGALLLPALLHDFGFKYNQLWFVDKDGNFMPYYPLEFLPDEKQGVAWDQIAGDEQRNAWDQFLYEVGGDINGLKPVNWTIRLLGKIGLTKKTWANYRDESAPVIVPVKPVFNKNCLCKYNPLVLP